MSEITSQADFDKITSENKVVLVDFFATWCGPCQMMTPVIEEIREKAEEKKDFAVITVDIDAHPDIAAKHNVMSVPTFMFFQDGKDVDTIVGAAPKEALLSKITQLSKQSN